MSAALDLLSECTAAGVELYLDNGRLRYRAW
jgi:tubulysin polyketide synthase-like protein